MNAAPGSPVDAGLAEQLQSRLVEFVRLAHNNNFRVGVAEELDAQKIALSCGILDSQRLHWGLRALLCSDQDDWDRFDDLFDAYWKPATIRHNLQSSPGSPVRRQTEGTQNGNPGTEGQPSETDAAGQGEAEAPDGNASKEGASLSESMETADFQMLANDGQMRTLERLVERLAKRMRKRISRRQRMQKQGRRIHLRATLRNSLRYGGTPLQLIHRKARRRQPRLILIVDVSRSMSLYSYLFLRFARGLVGHFRDASAFAYHTRLVPITDALRQTDVVRMQHSLALISQGWSGGTRIGECLASFNDQYGAMMNNRSLVVVVSDGLDTGDPEYLSTQLGRIRDRCRKLVWLNPLLGRPGYEPKTQSMQAALPYLDLFAPAHNVESLQQLEKELISL